MRPPVPANEAHRLNTLGLHRILDTAAEKILDDLTRLAAAICETPISLISLVDENRQWFKARVGLDVAETPREVAFCAHAILGGDLLVVEDARADDRFARNPLVTEEPAIRFYCGMPLVVESGHALGTLCVIDRRPGRLTAQQQNALRIPGRAVVAQLELRRAQQDLRAMKRLLPICAWCRSVRADDNTWRPLHQYITQAAPVTHGVCPACAGKFMPAV